MRDAVKRRELLKRLAGGALGAAGFYGAMREALASGDKPTTTGIYRAEGSVLVNDKPAKNGSPVNLGDRVSTGPGSSAVVVWKGDAFLLRNQTTIEIRGRDGAIEGLLVATGKVLSVFAKKPVAIKAAQATIGIRGTACYLEVEPKSVYFCLCYGEAVVEGSGMADPRLVKTTHHEQPLVLSDYGGIMKIEPGGFRDHSDAELVMLEALVGRQPPFMQGGQYPAAKY
jgi:uncharacterized Zn-binding protein involved in type VI secretion